MLSVQIRHFMMLSNNCRTDFIYFILFFTVSESAYTSVMHGQVSCAITSLETQHCKKEPGRQVVALRAQWTWSRIGIRVDSRRILGVRFAVWFALSAH